MRNIFITLLLLFASLAVSAQPSPVKKAAKSMFKLTTFSESGDILHTGYGVFVDAEGTCLSSWEPFIGASSANVIDAQGRRYDVDCLVGANEIYNVAKFRIIPSTEKKMAITPIVVATNQLTAGAQCWLVEYDVKSPSIKKYAPSKVETFATSLPYYIFEQEAKEEIAGSPFLNDMGELLGLMQPAKRRTDIYCPSAQYAMTLTVSGLTANEPTLKQTNVRVALPDEYNQAVLALMMASSRFSTPSYLATANEFIRRFPTASEGYKAKADYMLSKDDIAGVEAAMKECIDNSESKDDAHYAYSRLIYNKVLQSDSTFTAWTLDNAIDEIDAAYAVSPQPIYTMHKAKTLFVQHKFQEAYDAFMSLGSTNMRSGETYYYAALCQQQMNASNEAITALMDSAIACYEKPYHSDAAAYILLRAKWYDQIGQPRKAIADFNEYENIMKSNLNANFYYIREQVELNAKMFKPALDDINRAIELDPSENTYLAEKALLLVRVNMLNEAIETASLCENRFPDYGDAYAIHGVALVLMNKKADGIKLLNKAKELNSELADTLIEKYGK